MLYGVPEEHLFSSSRYWFESVGKAYGAVNKMPFGGSLYRRFFISLGCAVLISWACFYVALQKICSQPEDGGACARFTFVGLGLNIVSQLVLPFRVLFALAQEIIFGVGSANGPLIDAVGLAKAEVLLGAIVALFLGSFFACLKTLDDRKSVSSLTFCILLWIFFSGICSAIFY